MMFQLPINNIALMGVRELSNYVDNLNRYLRAKIAYKKYIAKFSDTETLVIVEEINCGRLAEYIDKIEQTIIKKLKAGGKYD